MIAITNSSFFFFKKLFWIIFIESGFAGRIWGVRGGKGVFLVWATTLTRIIQNYNRTDFIGDFNNLLLSCRQSEDDVNVDDNAPPLGPWWEKVRAGNFELRGLKTTLEGNGFIMNTRAPCCDFTNEPFNPFGATPHPQKGERSLEFEGVDHTFALVLRYP